MATINDVAKKAGVSITTVSYVLTGKRYVSDELQKDVRQAMKELGYRRNTLASSLRLGRTDTIGLVIPDSSNQFFAEMSRCVEDIGFENQYTVFLCNSDDNPEKQSKYLDVLIAKQVDGIVFISVCYNKSDLDLLVEANVPFIIVDRDDPDSRSDVVLIDNFCGGRIAANQLISLGHHKIACITGPSLAKSSSDRYLGYLKALEENGLAFNADYVLTGDFRHKSGDNAMNDLLNLSEPPTAVFVCNDMMAIGAIRAINRFGLKVPEDISIIGFDNIPIAEVITPALTTIAQPINAIAQQAMALLLRRMEGDTSDYPSRITLVPELIVRDSCRNYS
jgi:LacI family transcriptional regulator